MTVWCTENNLVQNTTKMNKIVLDFRRRKAPIQPLFIGRDCVERVSNFRFLGVHFEDNLNWSTNTRAILKKAQQRLFPEDFKEQPPLPETAGVLLLMLHREHALTYSHIQ